MRLHWLLIAAALPAMLFLSCDAEQEVDVPDPPSMDTLLNLYIEPSAPLVPDTVKEVLTKTTEFWELMGNTNGLEPVILAVFGAGAGEETERQSLEVQKQAVDVGGQDVTGDGYMTITRICNGHGPDAPVDADANGTVTLTAVFSDDGFNPVFWGEADNCLYEFEGRQLFLDGSVQVHTGGLFEGSEEAVILIEFDGVVQVDDYTYQEDFSFRLRTYDQGIEVNLELTSGNIVFYYSEAGAGFNASNGDWTCDFEGLTCTSTDTGDTLGLSP